MQFECPICYVRIQEIFYERRHPNQLVTPYRSANFLSAKSHLTNENSKKM